MTWVSDNEASNIKQGMLMVTYLDNRQQPVTLSTTLLPTQQHADLSVEFPQHIHSMLSRGVKISITLVDANNQQQEAKAVTFLFPAGTV